MKKIYRIFSVFPFWSLTLSVSLLLTSITALPALAAVRQTAVTQDMALLRTFPRDAGIDVTGSRVQLARSFLIRDEQGATDYKNVQPLSASMWARKTLILPYAADATLVFYGHANKITVNGHQTPTARAIPFTGWTQVLIPAAWLRPGANEFIFSDGGQLLVENSLFPDRSARSVDGGRTWQNDEMGADGIQNGEFLVRLRLKAYAPTATLTSSVIDLLDVEGKRPLRPRAVIKSVRLDRIDPAFIKGLEFQVRMGTSPIHKPETWTEWNDVSTNQDIPIRLQGVRYVQWRARLATHASDNTPFFSGVRIIASIDEQPLPAGIKVTSLQSFPLVTGSQPFSFQPQNSARLKLLRERYKLAEVIASGKTELEQLVLLRNWVRNRWPNGWAHDELMYCPPWDALLILDMAPRQQALGMCTHYSTVFVQCALALGWNARHLILRNHCAAEVWSDQFGKWIVIDAGNSPDPKLNCHFESNGIPLSALEIRNLWKQNAIDKIRVVYSPPHASISGKDMPKEQVQFDNYDRFSIPFRNNHLDTPFPGELEQGLSHYFHDGYLWWQDGAVPTTYPEYSHLTYRPQDLYWNLNQVALDLLAKETEGNAIKLQVGLSTQTPNFSHYLVRIDEGAWQRQGNSVAEWSLHPGKNQFEVKAVNGFGREGKPSSAVVEVTAS